MNKILSQALKKAVSKYSPTTVEITKEKRPDLFSLSNETELFQNEKGIIIKIDRSRDSKLTALYCSATQRSWNKGFGCNGIK